MRSTMLEVKIDTGIQREGQARTIVPDEVREGKNNYHEKGSNAVGAGDA